MPLTLTTTVLPVQSPSFRAWMMLPRSSSLAPGATESSRSMNTSSARRPGALISIFGEEPGTERHDRRGRVFTRAMLPGVASFPQKLRRLRTHRSGYPVLVVTAQQEVRSRAVSKPALIGALIAAADDVLYVGLIRSQGGFQDERGRVFFVASFVAGLA